LTQFTAVLPVSFAGGPVEVFIQALDEHGSSVASVDVRITGTMLGQSVTLTGGPILVEK
jgi:hypothetical protein